MIFFIFIFSVFSIFIFKLINLLVPLSKKYKNLNIFISFLLSFFLIPFSVPSVTFTNGERVVVFQGMVHIGSSSFYRQVDKDAHHFRDLGFTVVHEGVGLEIKEKDHLSCSSDVFKSPYISQPNCIGGIYFGDKSFDSSSLDFKSFSSDYLLSANKKDSSPVFSIDEVNEIVDHVFAYGTESYYGQVPLSFLKLSALKVLFFGKILDFPKSILFDVNPEYKDPDVIYIKDLWRKINNDNVDDSLQSLYSLSLMSSILPMDKVINHRDKLLANGVAASSDDMYVIYGFAHLGGFYKELKKIDSRWTISSFKISNLLNFP